MTKRIDVAARVRNHISDVLRAGPIGIFQLTDELVARGLELGPEPDHRVQHVLSTMESIEISCPFELGEAATEGGHNDHDDHEDLVFDRLALLDGITWTVPVSALDIASDTIDGRSLGLLYFRLLTNACHFEGGGFLEFDRDGRRAAAQVAHPDLAEHDDPTAGRSGMNIVALPEGWFAAHGARPGGFVQFRLDGDTVVGEGVETAAEPAPELLAALGRFRDAITADPRAVFIAELLTQLLVNHSDLRGTTLPPLDALFAAAELERDGVWVGTAGFDFAAERLHRIVGDAAEHYGLSDAQADHYHALELAWRRFKNGEVRQPEDLAEAARALRDLLVVAAFTDNVVIGVEELDEAVELLTFTLGLRDVALNTPRAESAAAWLVAQVYAHTGQTDQFEHWVEIAHREDPDHPGVVHDLAWFAFDRGDARKAQTLLNRLGSDAMAHDLAILDDVLTPHAPKARRNDPCPCGSGRKYKHCHLGVDEIGLDQRLTWLFRKANWWLGFRHRWEVEDAAWARGRHSSKSAQWLVDNDPLIVDAVFVEGGRFAEWLAERGALLPTDEAMLAGQWALIGRSVYQVTDVRPGEGLTIRDVRTGDVVDVDERLGSRDLTEGTYVLVRPLPTGTGRYQLFGGITRVPDSMLDRFLEVLDAEPTTTELLTLVAESEAPPSVANREGDALMFCDTVWELGDPAKAATLLDGAFDATEPAGEWSWLAPLGADPDPTAPAHGGRTVFGSLRIDGGRLTASTNSIERSEQLTALVADLLDDATLVEQVRSDLDDLRADEDYELALFGGDDGDDPDDAGDLLELAETSPEIRAVIRKQMDAYEEAWVDESIPLLGGATPREALDDPTRRDDLIRLLDQMEQQDASLSEEKRALSMRPERLRELLGL